MLRKVDLLLRENITKGSYINDVISFFDNFDFRSTIGLSTFKGYSNNNFNGRNGGPRGVQWSHVEQEIN